MSAETAEREYEVFIDAAWMPSIGGETYVRENPATGAPIAAFQLGRAADADRAVAAAAKAHRSRVWRDMPGAEKQVKLRGIADWLRADVDRLTQVVSLETGKPLARARFDVIFAADYFDYYSGLVRLDGGRTIPNLRRDLFAFTLHEPAGVAALLTPWNYPLLIAAQKAAPALAAGCTLVIKPAPWTPLTALELARACEAVEMPAGVVNVVTDSGPGSPVGEALVAHPDVSVVSFTGSSQTGQRVVAAAAPTLKKVALECGGKSPNIIHHDADLEPAVDAAVSGMFFNTGQVCNAGSRLFVHEDVADEFMTRLIALTRTLRIGDPTRPETQLGPVISASHLEHIMGYIELGREEGARLVLGGDRIADAELRNGYFLQPTVFDEVEQGMRIAREEIFGPVLAVSRYTEIEDAIADANATPYGLAGAIWSHDIDVITRVTNELDVGMVWVNDFLAMFPETPHGGYGMSGIGREMGPEALLEFQENKTVIQHTGQRQMRVR